MGVKTEIIDKSGSWYSYDGERIGQGRENVKKFLKENPDIYNAALKKVREKLGILKNEETGVRGQGSGGSKEVSSKEVSSKQ